MNRIGTFLNELEYSFKPALTGGDFKSCARYQSESA